MPKTWVAWTALGSRGASAWVESNLGQASAGSDICYHVAEHRGTVTGFLELRSSLHSVTVNNIHVADAWRGRGIGRRLLSSALPAAFSSSREGRDLSGSFLVTLDVKLDNERARSWYERLGFEPISRSTWCRSLRESFAAKAPRAVDEGVGVFAAAGEDEPDLLHDRYGFSIVHVDTAGGRHRIGRMGTDWFRIYDLASLEDPGLIPALTALDAGRDLFVIGPESGVRGFEIVHRCERMQMLWDELRSRLNADGE